MIEKSIIQYLMSDSSLLTLLGSSNIYPYRVPTEAKMPWICINPLSGGTREIITQKYTDTEQTVLIYIDADNFLTGRQISQKCLELIENYRGDMSDSFDVHLTCSPIRHIDGYGGSYRFLFDVYTRFKEETVYPVSI